MHAAPEHPLVSNETVSPKNESDRCRMLLQAIVYVRVGNYLRTSRTWSYSASTSIQISKQRYISRIKLLRTAPIGYVHQLQFVDYFDTFCRSRLFMIVNSHFLSHSRPSNFCSNSSTTKIGFQLCWTALTRHKPTRWRRSVQSFDMLIALSAQEREPKEWITN